MELSYYNLPCVSLVVSSAKLPFTEHRASPMGVRVTELLVFSIVQCSSSTSKPAITEIGETLQSTRLHL